MNVRSLLFIALLSFLCTCARAQKEPALVSHPLLQEFSLESPALSKFWGKPMTVKAAVLLPAQYEAQKNQRYPVRYNVAGYGGRYYRVNRLVGNPTFTSWWEGADAPQVITVFLDGDGPYGDPYQLNSANSGPYGDVLMEEIIPAIEEKYRTLGAKARYTDGCSTGGWVSLALQMFYPGEFSGCYSYSPDPVSFNHMQLINIYEDDNAFVNKYGLERPSKRTRLGEPEFTIKKEVTDENGKGASGTYVDSKGQWGAWNALYSPKGADGLPSPVFDPETGIIDKAVAEHWKQYDLLLLAKENWAELGPKLRGKVYVWMGDMDNYYLNNALREMDEFLRQTANPASDAVLEFVATKGHCDDYSHRRVLELIGKL